MDKFCVPIYSLPLPRHCCLRVVSDPFTFHLIRLLKCFWHIGSIAHTHLWQLPSFYSNSGVYRIVEMHLNELVDIAFLSIFNSTTHTYTHSTKVNRMNGNVFNSLGTYNTRIYMGSIRFSEYPSVGHIKRALYALSMARAECSQASCTSTCCL